MLSRTDGGTAGESRDGLFLLPAQVQDAKVGGVGVESVALAAGEFMVQVMGWAPDAEVVE